MPEEKLNKINVSVERQRSLKPELALIIYSEGPNMYGHEREKEIIQFMVTANGKFINPKALDMRSMQDIFNSAGRNSTLEYLDDRILAVNNTGVVWYEPSRKAEIYFDCPEKEREDLNTLCKGKKSGGQRCFSGWIMAACSAGRWRRTAARIRKANCILPGLRTSMQNLAASAFREI